MQGDEFGRTSLHMAAKDDDTPDVITRLITYGADLHARDEAGYSPLHYAASYNDHPDIIVRLVQCGSDLHAMNNYGWTPLHLAAGSNTPDVITKLMELGADGKAKTADGKTAWDLAQDNEALHGTEAMQLLNDARSGLTTGFIVVGVSVQPGVFRGRIHAWILSDIGVAGKARILTGGWAARPVSPDRAWSGEDKAQDRYSQGHDRCDGQKHTGITFCHFALHPLKGSLVVSLMGIHAFLQQGPSCRASS